MLIHWTINGPNCGLRTGTLNHSIGENWAKMVQFLRMTEPDGWLTSYTGEDFIHESYVKTVVKENDPELWFS